MPVEMMAARATMLISLSSWLTSLINDFLSVEFLSRERTCICMGRQAEVKLTRVNSDGFKEASFEILQERIETAASDSITKISTMNKKN